MRVAKIAILLCLFAFGCSAAIILQPAPGTSLNLITLTPNPPTSFAAFDIRGTLGLTLIDSDTLDLLGSVFVTDGVPLGAPELPSPNTALFVVTGTTPVGFIQFSNPRFGGPAVLLDGTFTALGVLDPLSQAFSDTVSRGLVFGFALDGAAEDANAIVSFLTSTNVDVLAVPEPGSVTLVIAGGLTAGVLSRRRR